MSNVKSRFFSLAAISLMMFFTMPFSHGLTNDQDVYAISSLYAALGSPLLPGWVPNGGDPCLQAWQGVQCVGSDIAAITINGANLGGQLGDGLGNFTSITSIDLSNNNIGGSIPENLPTTLKTLFLSANQFTGNIPSSLSKLTLLSDMSVNGNHLSADLPDAFQSLTGLINFDISTNNLSGQLPPSMESLSSLTTLHIQNNQFSGTLDVLQDLPLKDLNIENNLFSGPVPEKLLNIPNFKKDGNPFNRIGFAPSSVPSVPPPVLSPPFFPRARTPESTPVNSSDTPSSQNHHTGKTKSLTTIEIIGYTLVGGFSLIVIVLTISFCISKFQERKSKLLETSMRQEVMARERPKEPKSNEFTVKPNNNIKRVRNASEEQKSQLEIDIGETAVPMAVSVKKERSIDRTSSDIFLMPPPPPPLPPPPPVEKVIVNPISPSETIGRTASPATENTLTSVASYSVAFLQQYTNSFSEENLIKDSRLGKVFLAELSDGKLVGYCAEYGQRLIVYNYFSKKTLYDILHYEDDLARKLSWKARLQVALGAAKALEYLHEGCQPPMVHQDFEPNNILVNDELDVRISDCGLAPLLSSSSVTQLSGLMRTLFSYEAPEFNESGSYTDRSDVYSFGVVMLELFTGRKPYDSSRPRAEQHLVRWASSQLHDINNLSRMVDPFIRDKCPIKSLSQFADIINCCIQHGPEFRPPISEVVQDLTRMVEDTRREIAEASIRSYRKREERGGEDSD